MKIVYSDALIRGFTGFQGTSRIRAVQKALKRGTQKDMQSLRKDWETVGKTITVEIDSFAGQTKRQRAAQHR